MIEEINMIEGLANGTYVMVINFDSLNLKQKCEMFSKIFDEDIIRCNKLFDKHGKKLFLKDNVQKVKSKYIKKIKDYKLDSPNQ